MLPSFPTTNRLLLAGLAEESHVPVQEFAAGPGDQAQFITQGRGDEIYPKVITAGKLTPRSYAFIKQPKRVRDVALEDAVAFLSDVQEAAAKELGGCIGGGIDLRDRPPCASEGLPLRQQAPASPLPRARREARCRERGRRERVRALPRASGGLRRTSRRRRPARNVLVEEDRAQRGS